MAIYRGLRHGLIGGQLVTKGDDILSPVPSQKLYNHSPWKRRIGTGMALLIIPAILFATLIIMAAPALADDGQLVAVAADFPDDGITLSASALEVIVPPPEEAFCCFVPSDVTPYEVGFRW